MSSSSYKGSGQIGYVKYEIRKVFKKDGGSFLTARFWDREYVWQGKNCRSLEFSIKNLQSLKEAVDQVIDEVLKQEQGEAIEHDLPSGIDKNCNPKPLSFDDDDIPF